LDNVSVNDIMIEELADIFADFPGKANQTCCFNHILNLTAKTITKQFDIPTKKNGNDVSEAEQVLNELAKGLEQEKDEIWQKMRLDKNDKEDDNNVEGWIDEENFLTKDELNELNESILPVRMLIAKVSVSLTTTAWGMNLMFSAWMQLQKLAYKIVNSSTLLLPKWKKHLAALKIEERLMPRDVRTRWNSTFKMLEFTIKHRKLLDLLCGDRANGLRDLELKPEEWRIAGQLRDVLKVRLGAECWFPFLHSSHKHVDLRFFSTPCSSFLEECPISQLLYRQWTILTWSLPCKASMRITILPFTQPWQWQRRL
jgi:hypothetical protein